jgi:hypothetical protein
MLVSKNVDDKNVGNTSENVDEKKCWEMFRKILTKNVGNTPKNVDEKILVTFLKNVDEEILVTPPKNVDEKNVGKLSEKC